MLEHEINVHVGKRLRERRRKLRMTQQAVADRLGIRYQQITKYESAQNGMSAKTIWELAEVLQVPISYFYEGLARTKPIAHENALEDARA